MVLTKTQAAFYATWLADAGVIDAPADRPTNFYALEPSKKAIAPTITQALPKTKRETPPPPPSRDNQELAQAIIQAEKAAGEAGSLVALKEAMNNFPCPLKDTANNLVFADGNPKASVMFIGEAPGADEDRKGIPFVGPAGQLLDKMIGAIELSRDDVYITNILPWRPPANRNPLPEERALFRPFLNKHIEFIAPKIIVLLGAIAAKEILATEEGITKLRGVWQKIKIGAREYDVLPTFHPAYLLRQQGQKKLSWEDLQALQKKLTELS